MFWGRIISHRLPSDVKNVKEYNTDSYVKLALDMQLWFAEESKRIRYQKTGHLQVGDIFVIESKQGFQR